MTDVKLKCGSPGCDYITKEVSAEIAWGLLQVHRQYNDFQQGVWCAEEHQPKPAASGNSLKKPDRPYLDVDITEGIEGSSRTAGPGTRG